MIIVFDTETTGLVPGQIAQLSYVLDDGSCARGVNRFFAVDAMPDAARAVHGFSVEDLSRLSGGARFVDSAADILRDFRSAGIVVGHNLDFDMKFLSAELNRCGLRYRHRHGLCTMYYFTKAMNLPGHGKPKPPSLRELCDFFGLAQQDIVEHALALFGEGGAAHDARFDAAATHLCVRVAIARSLLRNLFTVNQEEA